METQKILLEFEPGKQNILPAIREICKHKGFIDKKTAEHVSEYFSFPLARVYTLASFFDQLKTEKERKKVIKVCLGGPCVSERSYEIIRQIEMLLKIEVDNDSFPKFKLETMSCRGLCDRGPVVMLDDQVFEQVTPEMIDDLILNSL